MATVTNAIENLRLNQTPYWWLYSGSSKVGQYLDNDNLGDSIAHFERVVGLLPDGSYKLKSSDKESNHSGAVHFTFTNSSKGQTSNAQPVNTMLSGPTTNAYGIPDHVYKQIQSEERQRFMFEQMYSEFTAFMKEWPDLKKKIERIEKIEAYLKDEDGDGTPDFMQMAKTASDTMNSVKEVKKVFDGGSGFRL